MADRRPRPNRERADTRSPTPDAALVGGQRDPWFRAAALAGAAILPLVLAASILTDVAGAGGLNPGTSDAELVRVLGDFRDRQMMAAALFMMAAVATLVFLGPLWVRLRVGSEALGVVAVGGGVAAAVLFVGWAEWSLAAAVAADYADAGAARFLMVSGWETARLALGPFLAMVGAATVAGYRHHIFGRWFNALGLVITVLLVSGLVPVAPAGLTGVLGMVWVLCAAPVIAFSTPPTSKVGER